MHDPVAENELMEKGGGNVQPYQEGKQYSADFVAFVKRCRHTPASWR